ncbi:hypothetical protein ABZV58_07845 [Nocardia sp. NPDC004654]
MRITPNGRFERHARRIILPNPTAAMRGKGEGRAVEFGNPSAR